MKHEHHKKPVHHKATKTAKPAAVKPAHSKPAQAKPVETKAEPRHEPKPQLTPQPQPEPLAPLSYEVTAVLAGPSADEEQLFILNEREHVAQVLAGWRGKGLLSRLAGVADGPSQSDWEHYSRLLDVYEHVLDQYELDMIDGIMPFRIIVTNATLAGDRNIKVTVAIDDGVLLLAKKVPSRPQRPEGAQHVMEPTSYNLLSGFVRRRVRLGVQSMSAEFSKLAGGDAADLVNETLFLQVTPETELAYTISSDNVAPTSGPIIL